MHTSPERQRWAVFLALSNTARRWRSGLVFLEFHPDGIEHKFTMRYITNSGGSGTWVIYWRARHVPASKLLSPQL
jgi:hypothetical protein